MTSAIFSCGKDGSAKPHKRKSSGWKQHASCFHGNKTLDKTTFDLSLYNPQCTPTASPKRLRLSPPESPSTGRALNVIPESECVDFANNSSINLTGYDSDEDKENLFRAKTWSKTSILKEVDRNRIEDDLRMRSPLIHKSVQRVLDDSDYFDMSPSRSSLSSTRDDTTRLLPKKVTRHMSADSGIDSMSSSSRVTQKSSSRKSKSSSSKKIEELPQQTLRISKLSCGYGFTIRGTCPVRVGRVKPEGSAAIQGLRAGDVVLSINGRDTENETVETIANIVRHSTKEIVLIIARKTKKQKSSSSTATKDTDASSMTSSVTSSVTDSVKIETSASDTSLPLSTPGGSTEATSAADSIAQWGEELSKQAMADMCLWQPELSVIREEKTMDLLSHKGTPAKWHPNISHIETVDRTQRFVHNHIYEEIKDLTRTSSWESFHTETTTSSYQPSSFTDSDDTLRSTSTESISKIGKEPIYSNSDIRAPPNSEVDTTLEESRYMPSLSFPQADQSDDSRRLAVHQLMTSEQDFCRLMKCGIQRFSRPLRHHLMSRSQHQKLFQNIEKLVALSEFHICSVTQKTFSPEDSYLSPEGPPGPQGSPPGSSVGEVYRPKVVLVCEAYDLYRAGLPAAMDLLNNLCSDRRLAKFIKRLENLRGFELSLAEFLRHPTTHVHQLAGGLSRVLAATATDHPDHGRLQYVVNVLQQSLGPASPSPERLYSAPRHYVTKSTYDTSATSSVTATSFTSSVMSVDTEILELQSRLDFVNHVKPFPLAEPCRHVIFSGDLSVSVATHSAPLWAVLCSDLLLLTQRDARGQLKVIDDPIFLQNIAEVNFNCRHPSEFRIMTQKSLSTSCHQGSLLSGCGVTEYKLHAPNQETKWAWKTLLEHRLKNAKSYLGDSAFCSMAMGE